MSWRKQIDGFLVFSRKDRIGMIALLVLIGMIYLLPFFFQNRHPRPIAVKDTLFLAAIDSLKSRQRDRAYSQSEQGFNEPGAKEYNSGKTLFPFDPNRLDSAGWESLGLNKKTIRTIYNYRNKGGRFRQASDLQKIWGLPQSFYARVKDYIAIPQQQPPLKGEKAKLTEYRYQKKIIPVVSINTADSVLLMELPGIGSRLSARIINFRDKLGGFHSVDQVAETYALPDSTFKKIRIYLHADASLVKKININAATKEELKVHPYIRWNLANAIVEYRNQHGPYKSAGDLRNILTMTDKNLEQLLPYLTF